MTAAITAIVAHLFPLSVEVDCANVPLVGPGGPVLHYTVTVVTADGKKGSDEWEVSSRATHSQMRDNFGLWFDGVGFNVAFTTGSAFVVTGTEKIRLKSIRVTGKTPADVPPTVRFIPKPR